MKYLHLLITVLFFSSMSSLSGQNVCNPNGNLMIYTNYDGGVLNINVDQNIPNLVIGVVAYEATSINLSGAFVGNVTAVHYAGFNGANNPCGGAPVTSISGAPMAATTSTVFAPTASFNNPNGYGMIICGYSCNNNVTQGGCNTVDQIEAYFLNLFPNSSLFAHKVQYACWSNTYSVSVGGSCCPAALFLQGSVAASQTVCAGATITPLTSSVAASGGTGTISYQWESSTTSPSAGFSNILSATSAGYNPPPINTTTYFRRGASTPSNPTLYSNVITVSVSTIGDVLITGPSEVCLPATATLTASSQGALIYNWSSSPSMGPFISAPAIVLSLLNPGPISVTCTTSNAFNCTATQSFVLTGLASPTITATGTVVCAGNPATITATGLTNYLWTGPAAFSSLQQNASVPVTNNLSIGVYTVSGTGTNICVGTAVATLSLYALPTVSVAASKTLICSGQSATLTAGGAQSYSWASPVSVQNAMVVVSPGSSSTYVVTGTDNNSCSATANVNIVVNICAGIEGLSGAHSFVSVYPNPASGSINLEVDRETRLLLVNNMGQVCMDLVLTKKSTNTLDVSNLAPGVYYFVNQDTMESQKLVILK